MIGYLPQNPRIVLFVFSSRLDSSRKSGNIKLFYHFPYNLEEHTPYFFTFSRTDFAAHKNEIYKKVNLHFQKGLSENTMQVLTSVNIVFWNVFIRLLYL